jgi:hypothetical protein
MVRGIANSKIGFGDLILLLRYFFKLKVSTHPINEQARVTFMRDSGFFGGGCSHDIYINDEKAFSLRPGEQATVYLTPQYYIFRLETGGGLCPNIATSQESELKENSDAKYRILLPSDGNLRLTRIK